MKRIIFLAICLFLLTVIGNLIFSIATLWSKKDVLVQARATLVKKQQEQLQLQEKWRKVQDPEFIEEQARDKLFLGKPGETLVLIPTSTPSGQVAKTSPDKPSWLQWWELFF